MIDWKQLSLGQPAATTVIQHDLLPNSLYKVTTEPKISSFFSLFGWREHSVETISIQQGKKKKKKTEGKRHDERRRVERKWDRYGKREPKRTSLSVRTTEAYFWRGNYRYECWAISLLLDYQSDMSPEWHSNSFQFLTSWLCRCSKGCSCFSWSPLKKNASFTFLFIPKLAPII